jgi:hypothetical protein
MKTIENIQSEMDKTMEEARRELDFHGYTQKLYRLESRTSLLRACKLFLQETSDERRIREQLDSIQRQSTILKYILN